MPDRTLFTLHRTLTVPVPSTTYVAIFEIHIVTCRLYTPLHYRIGGGRVRRQRYTWYTLTAGSLYQAACDRTYHGVIVIGHW